MNWLARVTSQECNFKNIFDPCPRQYFSSMRADVFTQKTEKLESSSKCMEYIVYHYLCILMTIGPCLNKYYLNTISPKAND